MLRLFLLSLLLLSFAAGATRAAEPSEVTRRLQALPSAHPRLFLPAGAEVALREQVAADPVMAAVRDAILREADRQLATQPVERVLIGRRLLDKSRTCLSRVLHLAMAWRLTGERRYLERARVELVAVARFPDWNPKHFLDVAEMTTAVAIGYDWLHGAFDAPTRELLRDAIVEKGLKPSLQADSWSRVTHNWNQVCNGGMTVGALAVAETDLALAARIVERAVKTVPLAMHDYAPDGAYPEGPGYWAYGTSYNVILLSALQSALGTDFGLAAQPGFLASADYMLHVVGPSGYYFNYSDAGRGGQAIAPALFWFARERAEPSLLWHELPKLVGSARAAAAAATAKSGERAFPFLLLWMPRGLKQLAPPSALSWTGRGSVPVAFHRSGWDADATFVALKGGTPSANHAHMDIGSFVMDADGVRWADDLGSQDYNSLESKGVSLWDKSQDGGRWRVFRLGTSAHNVLMVDGRQQRVDGRAPIVATKNGRTVVDLAGVYRGQLEHAQRGVSLESDRRVRVQDEFSPAAAATVRWAMLTHADVALDGPGRATLRQSGKTLGFRVLEPADARLKIYPTDPPPAATDAPNPGTRMIGFEVTVPAGAAQRLVVELVPSSAAGAPGPVRPLAEW